jgi:hypothetical protein
MPGSLTTPRVHRTRDTARGPVAFRSSQGVGCSGVGFFVAQWLAYALPCRRFAAALAGDTARLGADVVRYSFIVMDFHHLLLAGLPAHAKQSRAGREAGLLRRWHPRNDD